MKAFAWSVLAAAVTLTGLNGFAALAAPPDNDPHATGCRRPTQAELTAEAQRQVQTERVRLNRLGLVRVNAELKRRNRVQWHEEDVELAPLGGEAVGAGASDGGAPQADVLPVGVDNSALPWFPPIRSQGSLGSCACFSTTYYQMTHMVAMAQGWNAKDNADNTNKFSPKWTYNMLNGGSGSNGTWPGDAMAIMQRHGAALWADFPYDGNASAWCLDPDVWTRAVYFRMDRVGTVSALDTDAGLLNLKTLLANGYVLNFCTYVNSWQFKNAGNDLDTPDDDAVAGKAVAYWVNGTSGGHAMTIVGYNDAIWVDINGNGAVDPGEKGAFRIANSWGTGWREAGYTWFAYDGIRAVSAVTGGPSASRQEGWWYRQATWMTARLDYAPKMLARFTLNHAKRNQMRITLGVSDLSATSPAGTWYPLMLNWQGGALAFDGSTVARDGTFVFDFTDIVPAGTQAKRYYLGMTDSVSGDAALLKDFTLIDVANGGQEAVSAQTPKTADGGQTVYASVDYTFGDSNLPPAAVAAGQPTSGLAPLPVALSAAGSSDPDGTIVSYAWDFGDGTKGSGLNVSHTYANAGSFKATLTVTDDKGATASAVVPISVSPDASKVIYVLGIEMSLTTAKAGTSATAKVTVGNDRGPLSKATVTGTWSGVVTGTSNGRTGADGSVALTSPKTKKSGTFVFTVGNLSLAGYTYDPARNVVPYSASISTP